MKKIVVFCTLITHSLFGQVNLVPNPSFEQYTDCSGGIGTIYPYTSLDGWYNPNTCTPDYYNACWMTPPLKIGTTK